MTISLTLYSTSHCHLCEEAESLLQKMCLQNTVKFNVVEIADDTFLLEKYGLKIPVLKRLDNHAELLWPFTKNEIEEFIG